MKMKRLRGWLIKLLLLLLGGQVSCSLCSERMEPESLAVHQGEHCPKRIVTCEYCDFPLPAIDLFEHQVIILYYILFLNPCLIFLGMFQEVCGNRTELCNLCIRYIRLRETSAHELTCNGVPAETSRFNPHFQFNKIYINFICLFE